MTQSQLSIRSTLLVLAFLVVWTPGASAEGPVLVPVPMGDVLSEQPLSPVPGKMTFEEYEDMHRGLFQGFLYSGIPGGWHFYAGERKTGWILAGTVVAGIGMVIAGASLSKETDEWSESEFETMDIGEQRYEKVPTGASLVGDELTTNFQLRALERRREDNGAGALVGLGVAAIVGSYLYDALHGVSVIESKRRRVRYKYGQDLSAGVSIDPRSGEPKLSMKLSF